MGDYYDPCRPRETAKVVYAYELPDVPGKTIVGIHCTLPPNGATPPHTHTNASITSYAISGTYRTKLNDSSPKLVTAGHSWFELPADHVFVSENPSKIEPAVFFSTIVIDTEMYKQEGEDALFKFDPPWK